MTPYMQEILKLRSRVNELESENSFLRSTLHPLDVRFFSTGVTRNEGVILRRLFDSSPSAVTVGSLIESLKIDGCDNPDNNIKVYIYKLRAKLRCYGVSIMTVHGTGYFVPSESKSRLSTILDDEASQ
jgi:DNA-binding response OmpR family regulator